MPPEGPSSKTTQDVCSLYEAPSKESTPGVYVACATCEACAPPIRHPLVRLHKVCVCSLCTTYEAPSSETTQDV